ncbi:MAG: M14 family metallopeptidase, partial [Chloroflexia bacterium]
MNRLRLLLSLLALAGLLLGLIPGALGAPEVGTGQEVPAGPVVVRLYYESPEALNAVSGELDIWEVHHDQGYAVAAVSPEQFRWLQSLGYRPEVDPERTALLGRRNEPLPGQGPESIPGYPCYRTVEETYQTLQNLAANYPTLAELYDIGDSWDKVMPGGPAGYDIYALRITNENITPLGTKPTFFLMAEIHAREYTTAETATRFAEYILQNYGTNPEITFFVDYYRLYVVPMTNPDGRKFAEGGQLWRKNTDNDDGCNTTYGTDLNRNHSFKWGCCGGSSGNPCAETYRGPSAASEPETQAVQSTVLGLFPDQRGPGDNDPAPADATGILITLHSYSELVLWPWGWTYGGAPNETQLQTVGRKLAWYNNYTPEQSSDLYITDGTTDDWSYGELGIASFTFEMGTAFFQACSTFENTIWPNNRPALLYALTVAKTPYMTAYGPDALNAATNPPSVPQGQPVQLTATMNDTRRRTDPAQNIAAAEYFVLPLHGSTPPGDPGTGTPMQPADGSWNSTVENVVATVNTSGLTPGDYIIALRGKDANNDWGPFTAVFLTVTPPVQCDPVEILGVYT